ncbi:hypothetical protein BGZ80_006070 [Entomortierella chlamydospora]|uniref:SWIM-type domain-containing protein n=1 Tax=Entomortierella chlamydospora TaxID=101097 RepID=A0A9P6N7M4_9FUNG|nr:hypothetical protein BGZ80_006070 [Entomortierella chlamydospora]
MMNKEIRRDAWDNLSAFKWMQELEGKEYFTFYDTCDMPDVGKDGIVDKRGEYHGFASKWQMCQLLEYGETLFIDGTHKIYGPGNVQKDLRAIIYEKDIAEALRKIDAFRRDWEGKPLLKYLENYYFKAKVQNGDDGDNNAVEDAVNDEVSDEVNNEGGHGDSDEDSERGDETDGDYNNGSTDDNGQCIKKNVDARYKRDRWMVCYRQGIEYEHTNTNNLIEAWHRALKMHFFRDKLQRCADEVIYILTNDVVIFFEQKGVNAANNVSTSSPAQKQVETALKKAMECVKLKKRTFVSFLHAQSRTVVLVESFERPDIRYEVHLDLSRNSAGEISSCSCPVFSNEGECCEHIAMVMLANDRYPVFKRRSNWEPPLLEPQRDELTNDIDAPVVEGSATPKMDHLISQVEDIIQYFTTRDPNTPFSGLMEKGIQDFHLLIRKHDHPGGVRERQQNYKKIKLMK